MTYLLTVLTASLAVLATVFATVFAILATVLTVLATVFAVLATVLAILTAVLAILATVLAIGLATVAAVLAADQLTERILNTGSTTARDARHTIRSATNALFQNVLRAADKAEGNIHNRICCILGHALRRFD